MGYIKTEDLMGAIRTKCGIRVEDKHKDKPDFFREELLLIIAKLNMLENEASKNADTKQLIADTVNHVFKEIKMKEQHHAS